MMIKKLKENSHKKCFLPRVNMTSYNVLTDGRNFHDQSIGDQIKNFKKIEKFQEERR